MMLPDNINILGISVPVQVLSKGQYCWGAAGGSDSGEGDWRFPI